MRAYIISGEASGDLHGSKLAEALSERCPGMKIRGWGGDKMAAAGVTVVQHYRTLAFMGFVEVVRNLPKILRNLRLCKTDILAFQPDVVVLLDYPGFNMRIARWAHGRGIRVVYYITPQVWAWHTARVNTLRRYTDLLLVILPFEASFFSRHGAEAIFVGHPLLDSLQVSRVLEADHSKVIALLPGSRRQEVLRMLPIMLEVAVLMPEYQFIVGGTSNLGRAFYEKLMVAYPKVSLVIEDTYPLLANASLALVKSGTSTLEAALIGAPQVVCYSGSPVSYAIARRVIQVPYISLVNLILDRPLVKEMIQEAFRPEGLVEALKQADANREQIKKGYAMLRQTLGGPGASDRAAAEIIKLHEKNFK
jgi:lipid-A-disaccharide synthase